MVTTVIFDLDDTLYDEIDYCQSGLKAVARHLAALPQVTLPAERVFDALWSQFTGGNRKKIFNAGLDELAITYDNDMILKLVEIYRNHKPDITLPEDSEAVLSSLHNEYTLALLTDGFLPAQKLKVQALGIEKYFSAILYTEQLGRSCWKPSPVGFEKLLQTLNAEPCQTVYVADNEQKDFIAPNKLGFTAIQLKRHRRIHTSSSPQPDSSAKYIITEMTQLPELLQRI